MRGRGGEAVTRFPDRITRASNQPRDGQSHSGKYDAMSMYTDKSGNGEDREITLPDDARDLLDGPKPRENPLRARSIYSSSGHLALGRKVYASNNVREGENTARGYSGDVRDLYNRTITCVATWNKSFAGENLILVTNLPSAPLLREILDIKLKYNINYFSFHEIYLVYRVSLFKEGIIKNRDYTMVEMKES